MSVLIGDDERGTVAIDRRVTSDDVAQYFCKLNRRSAQRRERNKCTRQLRRARRFLIQSVKNFNRKQVVQNDE